MMSHHADRDYSCSECQGRRAAPSRSSCGVRNLSERASLKAARIAPHHCPEGPVFLLHLDEVDDHVFAPQVEPLMESIDSRFVEGLLLLEGSVKPRRLQPAGPPPLLYSESPPRPLVH